MSDSKKLLCVLLSLIMVLSLFTVAAVPAGAYNYDDDYSKISSGYSYNLKVESATEPVTEPATDPAPTIAPETEPATEPPIEVPTEPATSAPEQPFSPYLIYINADGNLYEVIPGYVYTYSYYLCNGGLATCIDATTKIDTPFLLMFHEPEYPILTDGTVIDNKFDDGYGNVDELRFTYSSSNGADFRADDSILVTFTVKVADDVEPGVYKISTKINTLCDENEEKQIFNGTDATPEKLTRREGIINGKWIRKDTTDYTVNYGEHTIGYPGDLLFTVNGAKDDEYTYSKFRALYIDGVPVDYYNYDIEQGSLRLTLKASYMDTLETGEHIMKYVFSDGEALGTLFINNYEPPTEQSSTPDEVIPGSGGTSGEIKYNPSDIPRGKSGRLNFYVPTTGWNNFGRIGFYIYEVGGEEFITWGSKKLFYSEETSPGVWSFDLGEAGIVLNAGRAYAVIFINQMTIAQTAPLLLDISCIGDTAYCTGRYMENEVDSNKTSLEARWKHSSLGPMKCITSIGNVIGETIPANTSAYEMFVNYLKNTLRNAREYSRKDDQQLIDDVAKGLGLADDDVEKAIVEAGVTVDWKKPTKEDIHGYVLKDYYLTGSINGDNSGLTDVHKELRFVNNGTGDMMLSGVKLKQGDKVKVALYNGGKAFTIYPDGTGREVVIDKSGIYDFYFKPYELGNPNYWYITPSFVGEAPAGVTVSGTITSYLDDSDVTVKLTGADNNFTAEVKGKSDYSIADVPIGEYTMTVSKANHVTAEYTVTVADADITQNVEIFPLGDVTGDGKTNVQDCTAILRYVRQIDALSDDQLKCGDVTGDNKVNVQDVTRILRHVRKIEALY